MTTLPLSIPRSLPRWLAAAIVAASVGVLGWQAWQLRQDFRVPAMPRLQAPAAPAAPGSLDNLFPRQQGSDPVVGNGLDGLQLQACLVADVGSQSRALIQVAGSGTLNLRVGDSLHDGLVLESVSHDQISLRQGSTLHILELDPADLGQAADSPLP